MWVFWIYFIPNYSQLSLEFFYRYEDALLYLVHCHVLNGNLVDKNNEQWGLEKKLVNFYRRQCLLVRIVFIIKRYLWVHHNIFDFYVYKIIQPFKILALYTPLFGIKPPSGIKEKKYTKWPFLFNVMLPHWSYQFVGILAVWAINSITHPRRRGGVYCFTLICLCAFCLSVCNVSASHPYEQLFLQVLEYSTHTGMPYHIVQSLFIPIELQLPVKMNTLFSF